jgi:type IV secretory pathway VirJ component
MRIELALSLVLASVLPSAAGVKDMTVSSGRLENVRLLVPDADPRAMVIYLSDRTGWAAKDDTIVSALRDAGDVVLGVDLNIYATALDKSDGECLYVVGELTDLAQVAQRTLNIQTYLPPILAGVGEGATFAYAALADAPPNTLGGAVASDFTNRLTTRLPFCPGSTATKTADGKAFSYAFDIAIPEPATLYVSQERVHTVQADATAQNQMTVDTLNVDTPESQIVSSVGSMADEIEPFGKLPAIDLPATTKPEAVAILISGDGGWRDLDKTMGEWLSTQGVHVVGLDSLHYFWSKRTPQELANDIAELLKDADPTNKLPVMMIGYSFGADVIPFAWPLLSPDIQARTKVLALLAPSLSTSFQVTISGWLGIDDTENEVAPAIAALPADKVMCIYGEDDADETACTDVTVPKSTVIQITGGHHFDGDYTAIARRFLRRL